MHLKHAYQSFIISWKSIEFIAPYVNLDNKCWVSNSFVESISKIQKGTKMWQNLIINMRGIWNIALHDHIDNYFANKYKYFTLFFRFLNRYSINAIYYLPLFKETCNFKIWNGYIAFCFYMIMWSKTFQGESKNIRDIA